MTAVTLPGRVTAVVTVPEYVDALRRRQRAARHTGSLVLAVHAVAVAVLAVAQVDWGLASWRWQNLVPVVVYVVLWAVVRVRERVTGMGGGRDGFGVMAAFALALALLPFGYLLLLLAGPGVVLGLGLVVVGVRQRSALLWGHGLVLAAVSPLARLGTLDNHAWFLGPHAGATGLGLVALALVVAAARALAAERAVLAGAPAP